MTSGDSAGRLLSGVSERLRTLYDFFYITFREFVADRLMLRAMALTHATLLSLVPLLIILFSLFKILGGGEWFDEVVRPGMFNLLAPGVESTVSERISRLIHNYAAKTIGVVGAALLFFGVYAIFLAIEMTFNLIWGGSRRGKFLLRAPIYWGLLIVIPLLIATSLAATTYISALPAAERGGFIELIIQRLGTGAMVTVSLMLIYRFLPTAPVRWSSACVGALIAGVVFEVSKYIFIFYARELVRYDVLYGSLAILPMLLIWINIAWVVTLFGVEVSYVYQHFDQLRKKQKRVPLSRLQQDALAWSMVRTALEAPEVERGWLDAAVLGERWGAPPGAVSEVVRMLELGGVLERREAAGDIFRLAKSGSEISVEQVDRAVRLHAGEPWPWPQDPLWAEIRNWLQARERRGSARKETLEKLALRFRTGEWAARKPIAPAPADKAPGRQDAADKSGGGLTEND